MSNNLDGSTHIRGLGLRGLGAVDKEKNINGLMDDEKMHGVAGAGSFDREGASPSSDLSPRTMVSLDLTRAKTIGNHRTGSDGDGDDDSTMKA